MNNIAKAIGFAACLGFIAYGYHEHWPTGILSLVGFFAFILAISLLDD